MKKGNLSKLLSLTLAVSMTFGGSTAAVLADSGEAASDEIETSVVVEESEAEASEDVELVTETVETPDEAEPAAEQTVEETASEAATPDVAVEAEAAADSMDIEVVGEEETVAKDAALAAEEEIKYVTMNVPYRVFYDAYGLTDMAVWEVEDGIDAVSTATTSKYKVTTGLAKGTYNNGTYIMGVTIPVAVQAEDYQLLNTNLTEQDNYYFEELDTAPAVYSEMSVIDGKYVFGKMQSAEIATDALSVLDFSEGTLSSQYGDYLLEIGGITPSGVITVDSETTMNCTIYGAVLNTSDQKAYGMTCLENIWFGTRVKNLEIAVSVSGGKGLKRGHGSGGEFYQFEGLNGAILDSVDLITDLGVIHITAGDKTLPEYFTGDLSGLIYSISADSKELSISGIPTELADVVVSVSGGLATGEAVKDGVVELFENPADGVIYTITISSSNYPDITRTVSTTISDNQKVELEKWIALAEQTDGYSDNADLKEHVQEAKDMLGNAKATSSEAAELIGELQEKVKKTYESIEVESAIVKNNVLKIELKNSTLDNLKNPTYQISTPSGRSMSIVLSGILEKCSIDLPEGFKEGTYTIEIFADNYNDGEASIQFAVEMQAVAVAGVNYYFADTSIHADNTVYLVSITTGRSPNQTTTIYPYGKDKLTQAGATDYYYVASPTATELSGTLYGYGTGTPTNYKEVYEELGVSVEGTFDVISSATVFKSRHAGDIPSLVTYGTDEEGNEAITGLTLNRAQTTVEAKDYVEANVLNAAGATLSEEQTQLLFFVPRANPMTRPSEEKIAVKAAQAVYTTSKYGTGEFAINLDESVEGYVWSEYWSNVYAATICDGTTTAGTVHWIDMYGEAATSGSHYNKLEIALNNGESVGSNKGNVDRFAAFYDAEGNLKDGTYTIKVYAEGYDVLEATVEVTAAADKAAADNAEALIKAAGGSFATAADAQEAVKKAQEAYNALNESQKAILKESIADPETALADAKKAADAQQQKEEAAKVKSISSAAVTLANTSAVYTGKAIEVGVTVKDGSKTLAKGTDYAVAFKNNTNVGTATVTITGKGSYNGTKTATFKITKAAQKATVKAATKKVKLSKVKKKKQTVKKAITVKNAVGTVTYKKVAKGSSKKLTINKKGVITVKKGTKKGTYKIKVKVTAAGNANYNAYSKTVTVKVKVK